MFDSSNLKRFIENKIEEYLVEEADPASLDNIAEAIDTGNLADKLTKELTQRILTFNEDYHLHPCPECNRGFGHWRGTAHPIDDNLLRKNGVCIIVADDF